MFKIALIQFAVTAIAYIVGVFIGMQVAKQHYIDAEIAPADFEDDLISHVGYDDSQCGYDK